MCLNKDNMNLSRYPNVQKYYEHIEFCSLLNFLKTKAYATMKILLIIEVRINEIMNVIIL